MVNNENLLRKFHSSELDSAINFFVKNGYVIFTNFYDPKFIASIGIFVKERLDKLLNAANIGIFEKDLNGFAVSIIKALEKTALYDDLVGNIALLNFLEELLGPDICVLNQNALWINYPTDKDPVLNKNIHSDAWTGTSENTLFCKYFVTDVDEHNGMSVIPGSHLWGFVPVKNRAVDPIFQLEEYLKEINLLNAKAGDILIWHALLLHSTVGHSDLNTRISITARFKSTETPFSSQERALGYEALRVGPMNQILRLIGNDKLAPFRTLGGFVGVDRRIQHLYKHSHYKDQQIDYSIYF